MGWRHVICRKSFIRVTAVSVRTCSWNTGEKTFKVSVSQLYGVVEIIYSQITLANVRIRQRVKTVCISSRTKFLRQKVKRNNRLLK